MSSIGGSAWGDPAMPGPPEYNAYQYRQTANRDRARLNPDRWGRLSSLLVMGLLAFIIAASIVFGITWFRVENRKQIGQEELNVLRVIHDELVTEIQGIPLECDCEGVNITFPAEFSDEEFGLFDADDPSRIMVFALNPLSGNVDPPQSLKIQDADGVVAYLADIPVFPTKIADDEFAVFQDSNPSMQLMFNVSAAVPATPTVMSIQNADGVVALLSDISDPTANSVFPQDEFEIMHATDTTKKIRFDVESLVSSGSTITVTAPDDSGVIAYLSDVVRTETFPDDVFELFSTTDSTKRVQFNASNTVAGIPTVMTFQNRDGTLAYRDQLTSFIDVDITESRAFPSLAHEGFVDFQTMGVTQIMLWMCGGGGTGRMSRDGDSNSQGGGGGAGGGYQELLISDPNEKFAFFSITIGAGGLGTPSVPCANGGTTMVVGTPIGAGPHEPWMLRGFGGGCGAPPGETGAPNVNVYGGCGAGSGGVPTAARSAGPADDFGGVPGACGIAGQSYKRGQFRVPWAGGSHGAAYADGPDFSTCTSQGVCPSGTISGGGRPGRGIFGGAGGMFGAGGDTFPDFGTGIDAHPNSCAGGGARTDTALNGTSFGMGGSGRVFVRYWSV